MSDSVLGAHGQGPLNYLQGWLVWVMNAYQQLGVSAGIGICSRYMMWQTQGKFQGAS